MQQERYQRQTMLSGFGEEGQRRLSEAKVLVVGLGGLGAPVATYLTGAGIGTLGLCDCDTIGLSNLQRQILYTNDEIGLPKTQQARQRLAAQNPEVRFRIHPEGLTAGNAREIIAGYDLVMDCTDNFTTRYLIDETCAEAGIPWVHGSLGEFAGIVGVMNHGEHPCRYRDLFPEAEAAADRPLGVIGPVAGTIGSIQACEAIKLLTGCGEVLSGRILTINLQTMQWMIFER